MGQGGQAVNQYYYKNDKCKADSARSKDCICWHDEGTGPLVDERHDYKHCHTRNLLWRVKPDELADWKRLCEERQQKLDEMATVLSRQQDHIKRLENWKESALEVEREWNANAIATMLGGKLGESQRKVIQREVPLLLDRIKRLEEAGDALEYASVISEAGEDPNGFEKLLIAQRKWRKAKEAKL
jgi:hypothetical protein